MIQDVKIRTVYPKKEIDFTGTGIAKMML